MSHRPGKGHVHDTRVPQKGHLSDQSGKATRGSRRPGRRRLLVGWLSPRGGDAVNTPFALGSAQYRTVAARGRKMLS